MKFFPKIFTLWLFLFGLVLPTVAKPPRFNQEEAQKLALLLNSDRIEYFFGSYGVEPLLSPTKDFEKDRISNLYNKDSQGQKIMRTLAIVKFANPVPTVLTKEHTKIKKGGSIGLVLKEGGWKITKKPLYFGEIKLSKNLLDWMRVKDASKGEVYIYDLLVSKNSLDNPIYYNTIVEIYSPDYLDKRWLKALYRDSYGKKFSDDFKPLLTQIKTLVAHFPSPN